MATYNFDYTLTDLLDATDDYIIINFPNNYFDKLGDFSSTSVSIDTNPVTFFKILA